MSSVPLPLAVRQAEKDRFGEVFTPPTLINAMLDKLPDEVWSDPTKKWLDPASGFGNFFMEVYPRLMKSLEHVIPEPSQRRRHILTQMLYMVEFNEESCVRIRENPMFVSEDASVNLFCGDFLDQAVGTTAFTDDITHFDIIVGNPPFNAEQTHKGKKGGGANLWPKFVEKSLRGGLLKPDGFLLFVHPALWRKPSSSSSSSSVNTLFYTMTRENHMIYLEIHNKIDGKRDFGVQTRYDYYIIQKRPPSQESGRLTRIKDQTGRVHESVDLSEWHFFLPNHSYEIIQHLLLSSPSSVSDVGIHTNTNTNTNTNINTMVLFSRCQYGSDQPWVSDTQDEQHIYPVVHSTPKTGPRMMWSSKVNTSSTAMFGVPKVIFGESGIHDVIIDIDGKYGMTQGAIGLKIIATPYTDTVEQEAWQMKRVLESREFHAILDAMSFSNFRIDWRMFLYFRPDFYKKIKKC